MHLTLFALVLFITTTEAIFNCTNKREVRFTFPDNFLWSTATSAYQIEGGAKSRGLSIWDTFAKIPGKIKDNSTGAIACDSYHQLERDLEMLVELGVKAYRFSISWPRIFPSGYRESLNQEGVDYYHRLIDGLRERNIEPTVTMYHWDLPQGLQDLGGWLNSQIVQWFGDYARFLYSEYGDKVHYWLTLNEPVSQTLYGYCGTNSDHAPGGLKDHCAWAPYLAGHHMILAHAEAYHVYKNEFKEAQNGLVGIANVVGWVEPYTPDDYETADLVRQMSHFWYLDPFFTGDYPPLLRQQIDKLSREEGRTKSRLPQFTDEQKALLKGTVDFLGVNYYITLQAKPVPVAPEGRNWYHPDTHAIGLQLENAPRVEGGWIRLHPEGLFKDLVQIAERYNNTPILITENGCMDAEGEESHDDQTRIRYHEQHIAAVAKALQAGVNVIGYNVWSLMDNFEWSGGYNTKFGLYHVDFTSPNRTRTPKRSALWYQQLIADNSIETNMC